MKFAKTASLAKDADGNGLASPGDTIKYTATITNAGSAAATGVTFTDTPDVNTTLVVGSVTTSQGSVLKGNWTGDKSVEVSLGAIPTNGIAKVTFEVSINKPLRELEIANQGLIKGSNIFSGKSDDPGTLRPDDPTITPIQSSPSSPGTSSWVWGGVAVAVLLGSAMVWLMRRRLTRGETH